MSQAKLSEMDVHNVLKASLDTLKPDLSFQKVGNLAKIRALKIKKDMANINLQL